MVDDSGHPVNRAQVLFVASNGTFVLQLTDDSGQAILQLPAHRLVTIFAAHPMLAPAIIRNHDPKNDIEITLIRSDGVGSVIFENGTGFVPELSGRINPIRDTLDRLYLYADNIAINDHPSQPQDFRLGEPLGLEDAQGNRRADLRSLSVAGMTLSSHECECPHPVAADPFCGFLDGAGGLQAE